MNIQAIAVLLLAPLSQGPDGLPVPHGPEDTIYDELAGPAAAGSDSFGGAVVPVGLDLSRVPESRAEPCSYHSGPHARRTAVQHVSAGPMGLHDGSW